MADYATVEDLAAYWRPLTEDEQGRANTLLSFASVSVRAHCGGEPGSADAARYVCVDMVKNAMAAGSVPVTSYQQSAGGYSVNAQFANPTGDLYWKKQYDDMLGMSGMQHVCIRAAVNDDEP